MNGLYINEALTNIFNNCKDLTDIVNNKIYLLQAKTEVIAPLIVFERTALTPNYCQTSQLGDTVTITVNCYSDDYAEVIEISQIIRNLLDNKKYSFDNINIEYSRLTEIQEGISEDNIYSETLVFEIQTN